jgi:hypothetical protein
MRSELDVNCSTSHAVCWGVCPPATNSCSEIDKTSGHLKQSPQEALTTLWLVITTPMIMWAIPFIDILLL